MSHAQEAATAAAADRVQPVEIASPTVSQYFASTSEAATVTQPTISRSLAKKMRHYFATAIAESDVAQGSAPTAASTTSDTAAVLLTLKLLTHRSLSWSPL